MFPEIPVDNGMADWNRRTDILFCILPFRGSTEMGRLQCTLLLLIRDAIRRYCGKVAFFGFFNLKDWNLELLISCNLTILYLSISQGFWDRQIWISWIFETLWTTSSRNTDSYTLPFLNIQINILFGTSTTSVTQRRQKHGCNFLCICVACKLWPVINKMERKQIERKNHKFDGPLYISNAIIYSFDASLWISFYFERTVYEINRTN